jgi:hypothetical protein
LIWYHCRDQVNPTTGYHWDSGTCQIEWHLLVYSTTSPQCASHDRDVASCPRQRSVSQGRRQGSEQTRDFRRGHECMRQCRENIHRRPARQLQPLFGQMGDDLEGDCQGSCSDLLYSCTRVPSARKPMGIDEMKNGMKTLSATYPIDGQQFRECRRSRTT